MYILTIILPFISFFILALFGRFVGNRGSTYVSTTLIGFSLLSSLVVFYEVALSGAIVRLDLHSWLNVGPLNQPFSFLFDTLTAVMLLVVLSVSFLVHLYSSSYMEHDPFLVRFMSYLSLFTFFMLCLVTSGNSLQMFLGWEGVGLSSYLLINFWYTRLPANKAAIKAVVVNRFGDFSLLVVLVVIYSLFRSFDYGVIFASAHYIQNTYITIFIWEAHALTFLGLFVFLGCVGKSAQLGLHTWLPDAMEGPTPVSALIHAATMVTAGVFLLIRFSPILDLTQSLLNFIALVGGLTAVFAATVGIFQNDLKRVIAYSTCSQLGYMVLACGLSSYSLSLFHLMNHAFFKALLFLSAGSVIHALSDEQDMRRMGGMINLLPFTYTCFVVGSLALMGFPYTSGFYSKDLILEVSYLSQSVGSTFGYFAGLVAAGCTAFYSLRLIYFTFLSHTNTSRAYLKTIHEPDFRMTLPLVVLLFASILTGYIFRDAFVGLGSPFFVASQDSNNYFDNGPLYSEFLFSSEKATPVLLSILFAIIALFIYHVVPFAYKFDFMSDFVSSIYRFFNKKWFFDTVYNSYIVLPALIFGNSVTFKMLDRGLIEFIGPTGLVRVGQKFSKLVSNWHSGYIFNYVFSMVLSLVVILTFSFFFSYRIEPSLVLLSTFVFLALVLATLRANKI